VVSDRDLLMLFFGGGGVGMICSSLARIEADAMGRCDVIGEALTVRYEGMKGQD
jgi:hypothetical protein